MVLLFPLAINRDDVALFQGRLKERHKRCFGAGSGCAVAHRSDDFALDHARARDAVHAAFDVSAIRSGLGELGMEAFDVCSRAHDRQEYLRCPDLGRTLDQASSDLLARRGGGSCRLVIVVGDGLSPTAVNGHAIQVIRRLVPLLAADGIEIGCVAIATGAQGCAWRRDRAILRVRALSRC